MIRVNFERLLLAVLLFLLAIIIAGSIAGLILSSGKSALPPDEETVYSIRGGKALFGDLGQIRTVSADKPPVSIVFSPFLEYEADDSALQEELVQKKAELKKLVKGWFLQKRVRELLVMHENEIKNELLKLVNETLNIGKVENIYFKEFKILN